MSLILDALRKLDRERTSRSNNPANIAVEILRPDLPRPGRRIQLYFAAIFLTAVFTAAVTYAVMMGVGPWSKSPPPSAVISPAPSQQAAPPLPAVDTPPESSSSVPVISPSPHRQVAPAAPQTASLPGTSPPVSVNPPSPPRQVTPAPAAVDTPPESSSSVPVISPSPHRQVAPAAPQTASLPGTSPPVSVNPPSPPQQVTPAPPKIDSVSKSSPPPPVMSPVPPQQVASPSPLSEPAGGAREETGRIPSKPQDPVENKGLTRFPGEQKESQNVISKEAEIAIGNARRPAELSQNRSETAPPVLKLTAIAWYEDPSQRFAFVNGIKTYEGGIINGVKIVEIHLNRVRFFHNGRHFEISME